MNRKIIDYSYARSRDLSKLVEFVNEMIKDGYEPIGGIAIEHGGEEGYISAEKYCQAMVKYSG